MGALSRGRTIVRVHYRVGALSVAYPPITCQFMAFLRSLLILQCTSSTADSRRFVTPSVLIPATITTVSSLVSVPAVDAMDISAATQNPFAVSAVRL